MIFDVNLVNIQRKAFNQWLVLMYMHANNVISTLQGEQYYANAQNHTLLNHKDM